MTQILPFTYTTQAVDVSFSIPILKAIQDNRPDYPVSLAVVASKRYTSLVDQISEIEGVKSVKHFDTIQQHVPQKLVEEACNYFTDNQYNILICIGGGSAIGLGKGMRLEMDVAFWAVPTTYAGSEMTNIYGITNDGKKIVSRADRVHPDKVFYDPSLSVNMPLELAVPSAFNALAHLVEAMYSEQSNPVVYEISKLGIRTIWQALHELEKSQKLNTKINEQLLLGAYLGGKVLSEVSMGLHHKTAHVLGGNYNLDHSKTHTLLLPIVLEYQWPYLSESIQTDFQEMFGGGHPSEQILRLQKKLHAAYTLEHLGFKKQDVDQAVEKLLEMTYPNPAPLEKSKLLEMLLKAF